MAAKIRALQQWCKVQCEGYHDVSVTNMTSSWKNGLAFCAIIHRFHPDLIDFGSLSKENVFENNQLAFDAAESLGIPRLLDPEDMVAMRVPDKLCIVTYLSQFYNHFSHCKSVGGPSVSVAVKRSANNTADDVVKRPALESVKHDSVQESAGTRRSTWQDKCCACHKKVYLMERHMNGSKLYHRQCFRHHERTSNVIANDDDLQSEDCTADTLCDDDCTNKAASAFVSAPSVVKSSDTPSLSLTHKADCTSHQTSSVHSPIAASSLQSCQPLAVVTGEQASVKPLTQQQQQDTMDKTSLESASAVRDAPDDISTPQESSVPARQQTDTSVLRHNVVDNGHPAAAAVNVIEMSVKSVEVGVPPEKSAVSLPCNIGDSFSPVKSTVTDAPEQKVESENTEETAPGKSVKTSDIPASVSESLASSLSSHFAVESAEHAAVPATENAVTFSSAAVSPRSCQQAPADVGMTTSQRTYHSPSVGTKPAVSLTSNTPQIAASLSCETVSVSADDVSNTAPASACAVVAPLSSELSCKTVDHAVTDPQRVVPRRPAPLPPRQTEEKPASNEQLTKATCFDSKQTTVSVSTTPETLELSRDVTAADQQMSSKHSLQSNIQAEKQSSAEAISKQCEEQTASAPGQGQPVPVPRHPRLPKLKVSSTDVEASKASSSSPESTVTIKAAPGNVNAPQKPSPVPKPRKSMLCVVEPSEVVDRGKRDVSVKHGDTELCQADKALVAKSEAGDSFITDSCMPAAVAEAVPAARPRSPRLMTAAVSCDENKSPSLSPSLPVKYPRSKKRCAAPLPPSSLSAVSPKLQPPEPEAGSATEPEPQTLGPPQRHERPHSHGSMSPQRPGRPERPRSPGSMSPQRTGPPERPYSPGIMSPQQPERPRSLGNLSPQRSERLHSPGSMSPKRPGPPERPHSPASISSQRPVSPGSISSQQPSPSVGILSQVANNLEDKSPIVNSEQTVSSEPVRRKITPGVKFTFEKDVFRPSPTAPAVDTSVTEHLKPSRPAPPRPAAVPVSKRMIAAEERLPVDFIKQRLTILDAELKKLEQDGCNMEDRIRSLSDDDADMMMSDWLDMVRKKNDLAREESELTYRLKQQELEDRHSQLEYELRRLMAIPDHKKTEAQRSREGKLLQRLLATVHRRNNIVDSMEEDRKRYLAEDEQISQMKATQGIDRKKKAG